MNRMPPEKRKRLPSGLRFALWVALTAFATAAHGQDPTEGCQQQYRDAERAYESGEFFAAADALWEKGCATQRRLPERDRVRILTLLAKTQLKLDSVPEAKKTIADLLLVRPDLDVSDPERYPAFFRELVAESKAQQRKLGAEVFVTKRRQNIDLAPAVITVYDAEDIEAMGARTLVDLLRVTPGFVELGDTNERNFGTRGISGTTVQHVLILINGHKLTDLLTSSTAPDWVSLDYVQQVEIVRGPGSPLYGGSAFGGVINIVTKNGFAFEGAEASVAYGTGNTLRANAQVGMNWSVKEQLYLSASFNRSDGSRVEQGPGRDLNVFADPSSANGALQPYAAQGGTEYVNRYRPGYNIFLNYTKGRFGLNANAQSQRLVYQRPINTYTLESFLDDLDEDRASRGDSREFVQLRYDLLPNFMADVLTVKVSFDHFHKDLFAFYATPATHPDTGWQDRFEGDEYRYTFDGQYSTEKLSFLHEQYTILGMEMSYADQRYVYYDTDTTDTGVYQGVTAGVNPLENNWDWFDNQTPELTVAAYAQTEGYVLPGRLALTVGLRNDYHWQYGYQPSPRLAVIAMPLRGEKKEFLKFKLLANSAFLPPPFLYRYGIPAFQGNSNIRPQTIRSIEATVFGNDKKNLEYGLDAYYNRIVDFIAREGGGRSPYNNVGNMQLAGLEATVKYTQRDESRRLDYVATLNVATVQDVGSDDAGLTEGRFLHENGRLRNFPGVTSAGSLSAWLKARSDYSTRRWLFNLSYNFIGETPFPVSVGARSDNADYDESYVIPEQFLLHANVEYFWKRFTFGLSCHNLFDRRELMGGSSPIPRTGEGRMLLFRASYRLTD